MQGPPLKAVKQQGQAGSDGDVTDEEDGKPSRPNNRPPTASQKYKAIIDGKKLDDAQQHASYETKDLLWGVREPPRKPKMRAPPPNPWKPRVEVHEGREMAVQGMHYWVRRDSYFNPPTEPRHLGFTTMLIGVLLYYLNLFLYWGVLAMYGGYEAPSWMWEEYNQKKADADLRGFPLEASERKDRGIYYLEGLFQDHYLITLGVVFFCPVSLAVYNWKCNSHRHGVDVENKGGRTKGGMGSALRSLVQIDLVYEMLLSLTKKDQTYQYRFIKVTETLTRAMPMATTQMYIM